MDNRARIAVATALSFCINVAMLQFLIPRPTAHGVAVARFPQPIVLDIQPEEKEFPQFVEPIQARGTEPEVSDRIAEIAARAMSEELRRGEVEGPTVEEEAPLDSIAAPAQPALPMPEPEPAAQVPLKAERVAPIMPQEEETEPVQIAARPVPLPLPMPEQRLDERAPRPDQRPLAPSTPSDPLPSRGRLNNTVKDKGFMNYAALEHELAPYLKHIQEKVRREWYTLLMTRYSGTRKTEAEIEIAINAEGNLEVCEVLEDNRDPVFAALCQEAIRRATPFTPFNFEVPNIYRNKNLEIYWTFSFL